MELALIEMGEHNVFPFVGRQTQIQLAGVQYPVYPVITGTFGGVDFLHSVMGEFDDKATQSEIQQLEGTMQSGTLGDTSLLKDLLGQIPGGLLGGGDPAGKADELQANSNAARLQNIHVTPKKPEALTQQLLSISKQIYPVLEWHDNIMRAIAEAIEAIPVLPELVEQLEDQINIFVFTLLAPFMLPVINQLKVELNQGSSEIIQSSKDKQLNVFYDDHSTDPTHSMLSKDHFSDVLNEVAGKIASSVVRWVVPQLMQAWDDPRVDVDRTINRIVNGVFHHPALRNTGDDGAMDCRRIMFGVVDQWWHQANQPDLREQLSREGVEQGLNHKPGQHDTGHGCGKPLGMAKHSAGDGASGMLGELLQALSGGSAATGTGAGYGRLTRGPSNTLGDNALGGIVGALAGGVGGGLLGEVLGGGPAPAHTQAYAQQYQTPGGGVTQSYTEFGKAQTPYGQPQYGQAQYQQTQLPGGGQRTEYKQYGQSGPTGQPAYGYEERVETRPTYGGGYETAQEKIYKKTGGAFERDEWHEGRTAEGEFYQETKHHERRDSGSGDDEYKRKKHHKKHRGHGSGSEDEDDRPERFEPPPGPLHASAYGGYGRQEPTYGRPEPARFDGGYQGPPREEFARGYGARHEEFEPRREEYGHRGGFGGGFEERRQEYGGRGGFGGRFEEGREEYGGRGGFGGGFEERREEFGGRGGFGRGFEERREEFGDRGGFGRGFEGREEFGGRGGFGRGFEERREEFGGRGDFGRGFEERREEFGGRGGFREGFEEPRQEYSGRGDFGEGFGERREEYGARGGFGGGFEEPRQEYVGDYAREEREEEREEEYREEVREERYEEELEERREEGGWGF